MKTLFASLAQRGIQPLVKKALALKPRGCVRDDRLVLNRISGQLQLEWRARDIHPWDRGLPPDAQAELYREQVLTDAYAAIVRLFQMLPEIAQMEIRVLDANDSSKVILAGVIAREDLPATEVSVSKWSLKRLGIQYSNIVGNRLEPLSVGPMPMPATA
jgi:hypothetical protein